MDWRARDIGTFQSRAGNELAQLNSCFSRELKSPPDFCQAAPTGEAQVGVATLAGGRGGGGRIPGVHILPANCGEALPRVSGHFPVLWEIPIAY